jgi:hypothetical protein
VCFAGKSFFASLCAFVVNLLLRQRRGVSLLAILMCCGPASSPAQSLQFAEETIEVGVYDSYCTITGTYTFRNHTGDDAIWSIFYPLLNTKRLPFPDSIAVSDTTGGSPVPFSPSKEGISFPAKTPASSTSTYRIFYRQKTPAQIMEYILTTTKEWGRGLDRADYIVRVPDSLRLVSISMPYDTVIKNPGERIYTIHKAHFLPEKNLVVKWRKRKS